MSVYDPLAASFGGISNHSKEEGALTYRLYYALHSAAMGVRVLLEEIGAPYELIDSTIDRS